ncbi:MAG: YegS/Rv2252/BmrU family lipid kinase [Mollicutes bacterium]|nr:YegS/Rv2252/BmrU family lipid kinase [Mollicutes bacterium]
MKYIFVINSFTLKDEINEVIHRIKDFCVKNNMEFEVEINNEDNSTEDIVKKYKKCGYTIVAVGGDGMINRVLNALVGTNNTLGFIPCGTGNDFYRSVSKEMKNEIEECDVIKINDRYFINVACFGIDADVANNKGLIKSKIIPKSQRYNVSVINSFLKYEPRHFILKINNEEIEGDFATVAVCNGGYYGSGYNISPKFKLNNGLIDVYAVEDDNKFNIMKMILSMKKGKHEKYKKVHKFQTNKLTIISNKEINSNIDGEELESKKFNIEVKGKIKIYINKELINFVKGRNNGKSI